INVGGEAGMAAGDVYGRAGAILHQAETENEPDGPNRDEEQKGEGPVKAEERFARFARGYQTDDSAPDAPRGSEKKPGETKLASETVAVVSSLVAVRPAAPS